MFSILDEPDERRRDEVPVRYMQVGWLPANRGLIVAMSDGSLRVYNTEVGAALYLEKERGGLVDAVCVCVRVCAFCVVYVVWCACSVAGFGSLLPRVRITTCCVVLMLWL